MGDFQTRWIDAMRRGDYVGAWRINDIVMAGRDAATRDDPRLSYHLRWVWDGRSLRGRHVLVRCYHGLGDTLQFARYLPGLRRLVASLTVEVQPELLPLLASVPGPDRLVPFRPASPMPPAECDVEIMELAHALRTPPETLPPPYLHAMPGKSPPGAIGLCWQAGGWDADRSLPQDLAASLTRRPCISLQPGRTTLRILNREGSPAEVAGTAALIAGLGLVITVDTMVAHLAGAMNRPTWLLLKHDADWRWMREGTGTPWYPSMRLYRQPRPGDWHAVIARVAADLAAGDAVPLAAE